MYTVGIAAIAIAEAERAIDVRDFGAIGDSTTLATGAIQAALDACSRRGGGEVHVRGGTFLAGTIVLRSNVVLRLHPGAVLLASTTQGDFTHRSLIYAEDAQNINSCHQVRVSNCRINSDDDAIVLKSTTERSCSDVVISNCVVSSNASAIKFDTESGGGFENVNVHNCSIYDTRNSGLALEIVDGGVLDRVNVSNITMRNVKGAAIFLRLGNRGRPYRAECPGVGLMRNIMISNVRFHNVDLRFAHDDHRPALFFDDVRYLSIFNLDAQSTPSTPALIRLRQVDGVLIHGSRLREMAGPLLRIEGDESANIHLVGNDLTRVKRVAVIGDAVPPGALFFPSGPDERK